MNETAIIDNHSRRGRRFLVIIGLATFLMVLAATGWGWKRWENVQSAQEASICRENLKRIMGAKEMWGQRDYTQPTDRVSLDSLCPEYLLHWPECPSGSAYSIEELDQAPVCRSGLMGHKIELQNPWETHRMSPASGAMPDSTPLS